jgi:hypothetical protein
VDEERDADELSAEQLERAVREEGLARRAPEDEEADQHQRRAEKARYLRERLQERARSEQDDDR